MTRDDVLKTIAKIVKGKNAAVFIGNGYNARALCALSDNENIFYMLGSMSLGPTLAAGFSHFSHKPLIVIEGDGNALMGLSSYPVAVFAAASPFIHIVLDNAVYESTGGQKTLSPYVDLL